MTGLSRGGVAVLALLLLGCAAGAQTTASATAPSDGTAAPSAAESESVVASPALPYEEVEFSAEGGPNLRGRVWSEGDIGVVLAHGFDAEIGQDGWDGFAEYLADLGYGVLTFDFRGFCDRDACSESPIQTYENWRDAAAAVDYLRAHGSERIFLVGASMGGLAAFRAADEAELELAGIISLATPQFASTYYFGETASNDVTPERLQRIGAPKLFIAGATDAQVSASGMLKPGVESVRFADDARAMFEASDEPKQLEIVDSGVHSSGLVTTADPEVVEHTRELIVAFIEEHA